nr:AHS beta [Viridiscus sp. 1 JF-2023a]
MALRFAALLLLVAASVASAQRFSKHETIRALPESCQQGGSDLSPSSFGSRSGRTNGGDVSTFGPCKLLPPVYEQEGYEFCLKCKAGEKNGVTAEDLAQSIRQVVDRKLKRNSQFSRQAKLNLIFDGVKQPIDLTRVLANTPEVLEKIDDVFFFFPNGQIGRVEFEHGQPDELERITCRPPCRGGPRNAQQSQSSYQRNQYNEDEDQDEQQPTYTSSSSRYFGQTNKNKKYPYSYGETSTPSYGSSRGSSLRHGDDYYGSQSQSTSYSRNAGRYGDNKRRSSSVHQEEEDDK